MKPERRGGEWSVLPKRALVAMIEIYRRYVSPCLGRHCRFHPTCSSYAVEALRRHGLLGGCALTLRRLLRCHPFHPGGFDPVPPCRGDACRRPRRTLAEVPPAGGDKPVPYDAVHKRPGVIQGRHAVN